MHSAPPLWLPPDSDRARGAGTDAQHPEDVFSTFSIAAGLLWELWVCEPRGRGNKNAEHVFRMLNVCACPSGPVRPETGNPGRPPGDRSGAFLGPKTLRKQTFGAVLGRFGPPRLDPKIVQKKKV